MLMDDRIPDFTERRMGSGIDADGLMLCRFGLAMAGDFLLHFGHNAFRFSMTAVDHEPARAFRYRVAKEDNAQAKNRADAERQPPAQADGDNSHVKQHDGCTGTDGSADPEAGVDDEINASADTRGDQFIDGRVDGGIFAADAGAGQSSKKGVGGEIP